MTSDTHVEGRPVCGVKAADCRCHKDAGHVDAGDQVHECDPNRCTGAWKGEPEVDESTFSVVRLPFPVGEPRPWDF